MHVSIVATLFVAVALAGCFDASSFPRCGDVRGYGGGPTGEVCVDGDLRSFLVATPEGKGPFPLLLALHGGGGSAENMQRKTGLDDLARSEGVVVVYPDGTPAVRGGDLRTWNAVHCCGRAWDDGTDDVAFLDAVVDTVSGGLPIDATRVGVTGHSNGAMMAHRYAAERADRVCCVVSVAGTVGGASPPDEEVRRPAEPSGPVAVLLIHATDDPRVPFDGGVGDNVGIERRDLSVSESAAFWEAAGGQVKVVSTHGGHGWPGGEADLARSPREPDASALAVAWLLEHPQVSDA